MRKIKLYSSILLATIISITACKDDDLDRLNITTIESGAILRTISKQLPAIDITNPAGATMSVDLEFDDFLGQDTMESVDVFASFVDATPVAGQVLTFNEVSMGNVSASTFTANENGKLQGTISMNIGSAMSAIGVTDDQLYGGDIFLMRLVLNTTDGRTFTSDNVGPKIQGSSAFVSPFRYSGSVVCPPLTGTWTIDMQDSYGDGFNGAAIEVNLDGVITPYSIAGSSGSATIEVPSDAIGLVFSFKSGDYDSEITFQITAPNGVVTDHGPSPDVGSIDVGIDFCTL